MPRPRVISEFTPSPVTSSTSTSYRIPVIMGEGRTSFSVSERVTRGNSADPLVDTLAHTALSIIRVGNYSTTTDYAVTTDYTLGSGNIHWVSGHGPSNGASYYVSYTYAKVAADYAPKLYDNFDAILAACGPILSTDGLTLDAASYLTMAASLMMNPGIGTTQLIVAQIAPQVPGSPLPADFSPALTALMNAVSGQDPYYLIPLIGKLSSNVAVAQVNAAVFNHCVQMADPQFRKERRCYTGLKSDATINDVITACQTLGADVNSSRITMMANSDPLVTISTPNGQVQVTLDGSFCAAAVAGYRSTQQVSMPALNKMIPVFDGFGTTYSSPQIDTLDDSGATVLEDVDGTVRLVNDVTVRVADDIEKSIPTVETRDDLAEGWRNRLKARFLGLRGGSTIPSEIEKASNDYLDERIASGDIQAHNPTKARRQPNSITKFQVSGSYLPAGEVLEIKISFSIDLNLA